MTRTMRYLGVMLVVSVAVGVVGVAAAGPQTEKQKQADALFEDGRKLVDKAGTEKDPATKKQLYTDACAKFDQAIGLDPDAAGTMLNLGLCNENLEKYKTALYWFRKAQARATEIGGLQEYVDAAAKHTTDLVGKVGTITVAFKDPPPAATKVKVDGEIVKPEDFARVEVDPGHHVLEAGAPGYKLVHQEFDTEGRGGQTLDIQMVQGESVIFVDRGAKKRKMAFYLGIGGGALMVAAGILTAYERHVYCNNFESGGYFCSSGDTLKPGVTPANNANHARDVARYGGTITFGVGAIAFGVATYLYLTAPEKERINQTVFVPTASPDGVGFALTRGF